MYNKIKEYIEEFSKEDISEEWRDISSKLRGMSAPGIMQILNKSVSLIDNDKCYLEVGSYAGKTMVGASYNNDTFCYGIDNFCQTFDGDSVDWIKNILYGNIEKYNLKNTKMFEEDYRKFFSERDADIEGRKIEVYFNDGNHTVKDQYYGVKDAIPFLADNAIVMIDDYGDSCKPIVDQAVKQILEEESSFSILRSFENDVDFWNGLLVLEYKR